MQNEPNASKSIPFPNQKISKQTRRITPNSWGDIALHMPLTCGELRVQEGTPSQELVPVRRWHSPR